MHTWTCGRRRVFRQFSWLEVRCGRVARYVHAGRHIGYEIRPSKRRQGFGTVPLYMGLQLARHRGLPRVLLTCDETDLGSRRVIENGGVQLENAVEVEATQTVGRVGGMTYPFG